MALWEGIAPVELERGPAAPRILVTDCAVDMQEAPAWHELVEGLPGPDPVTASPEPGEKGADGITEPELEPDALDDGGSSLGRSPVSLEPLEKEWLQGAARGHLSLLRQLLQQEPALAGKKDFTSGFTALHWAAKHGEEDMAALLLNAGADPNMRAHGGYTPLHIAALHGHRRLMEQLIWRYGAKENVRDYSGRLARHYLRVEPPDGAADSPQLGPAQGERGRHRKLTCLLLPKSAGQTRKRWGSAEDLVDQESQGPERHLAPQAAYRAVRKFSR